VVLAVLALRPLWYAARDLPAAGRRVEAFVRGLDAVPAGAVVVPLVFGEGEPQWVRAPTLRHALGYAAAERGLIDWDDYEAMLDYFPVRFRPEVGHGDLVAVESDPQNIPLRWLEQRVDYFYCWRMPADSGIAVRLARQCRLVGAGRDWQLFAAE
jgi:hypothetical protein